MNLNHLYDQSSTTFYWTTLRRNVGFFVCWQNNERCEFVKPPTCYRSTWLLTRVGLVETGNCVSRPAAYYSASFVNTASAQKVAPDEVGAHPTPNSVMCLARTCATACFCTTCLQCLFSRSGSLWGWRAPNTFFHVKSCTTAYACSVVYSFKKNAETQV